MYKLSRFNLIIAGAARAFDIILDMGPASQPADSMHRDGVHPGVGLPAGRQALSAKAGPAPHFRPARAFPRLH